MEVRVLSSAHSSDKDNYKLNESGACSQKSGLHDKKLTRLLSIL
jgi:hypothetical protein